MFCPDHLVPLVMLPKDNGWTCPVCWLVRKTNDAVLQDLIPDRGLVFSNGFALEGYWPPSLCPHFSANLHPDVLLELLDGARLAAISYTASEDGNFAFQFSLGFCPSFMSFLVPRIVIHRSMLAEYLDLSCPD